MAFFVETAIEININSLLKFIRGEGIEYRYFGTTQLFQRLMMLPVNISKVKYGLVVSYPVVYHYFGEGNPSVFFKSDVVEECIQLYSCVDSLNRERIEWRCSECEKSVKSLYMTTDSILFRCRTCSHANYLSTQCREGMESLSSRVMQDLGKWRGRYPGDGVSSKDYSDALNLPQM